MTLSFIRVLFLIICGLVGYYVGTLLEIQRSAMSGHAVMGAQVGCLSGLLIIFLEGRLRQVSLRGLSSMVFGLLLGVFMAKLISSVVKLLPLGNFVFAVSELILTVVFSYLGAVMALRGKDEFNIIIPYVRFQRQDLKEGIILLDSSAIIDGRISEIYKTSFLPGRLVVPRFILLELQKIADSEDDLKRQKGRRGLELLRQMQADPQVDVRFHEDSLPANQEADTKLISLAKMLDAKICTTDFNLNRIASLQNITILNVHKLVNAVKSTVSQHESFETKLIKEGKEANQAIGYLDDGTMIVVSDAKHLIGQVVAVSVTSVLQTEAGRMIFARLKS